jgi:hypothetical protein
MNIHAYIWLVYQIKEEELPAWRLKGCLHRLTGRNRISFIHKNDRLRRTILLTGTALDADIDINMGLRFPFSDGIALTADHTGTTQDTFVGNKIRHTSLSVNTDKKVPASLQRMLARGQSLHGSVVPARLSAVG